MPNRILKESICTSDTVDQLSWFEECFFTRLIVNCDDFGRMDARPAILKARLFPLKNVTEKQVSDALNKLSTVGIAIVYKYDDRPYLQLVTWESHQQVRAKKSKYPAPDESDAICNQAISDDIKCPRNPIQSESNPNPNPSARARMFDEFWAAYPKKKAKREAEKAFHKLKPDTFLLAKMIDAIEAQSRSPDWQKDNGQFIPYPATWLNGRRWEDESKQRAYFDRPTENYDHLAIDPFAEER